MQAVVLLLNEQLQPLFGPPALLSAGQIPSIELTLRWLESSNCTEVGCRLERSGLQTNSPGLEAVLQRFLLANDSKKRQSSAAASSAAQIGPTMQSVAGRIGGQEFNAALKIIIFSRSAWHARLHLASELQTLLWRPSAWPYQPPGLIALRCPPGASRFTWSCPLVPTS